MKHITTLFIGFLISINIHAQTEPLFPEMMGAKTIDFPTPNAASLGKYGQILKRIRCVLYSRFYESGIDRKSVV